MLFGDSTNSARELPVMESISKGGGGVFEHGDMVLEQGRISVGGPRPKSRAEIKNRAEVFIDASGAKPNTRLQAKRSMRTLRSASVKGKAS